jgi:hypothetical protein
MEEAKLKAYLDEGLSLNAIGKREGKSLGSVRYWMQIHGFKANFKNFREDPSYKNRVVDGKKCCGRCKVWKPLCDFNSKGENYYHGFCRTCLYEYQAERWRDKKKKAVELMGGKCIRCGYCRNYAALEFHHVDPSQKDFDFNKGRRRSWDKLIVELKKCVLLCSNCHKEEHHPETILDGLAPQANVILNLGPKPTGHCPSCQTEVFGTKYCSQACSKQSRRRANRPSKEELARLIETTPIVQIGKMYKVSDNAIRKWANHYGLKWKKIK